jgi:hypothetical protein
MQPATVGHPPISGRGWRSTDPGSTNVDAHPARDCFAIKGKVIDTPGTRASRPRAGQRPADPYRGASRLFGLSLGRVVAAIPNSPPFNPEPSPKEQPAC